MTKTEREQFSDFLKKSRELLGYSKRDMGYLLHAHGTTYSRWERGACKPNEDLFLIKETVKYMVNEHMKKMNSEWERLMHV